MNAVAKGGVISVIGVYPPQHTAFPLGLVMQRLREIAEREWRRAIDGWQGEDRVVLLDALRELLCRTACAWADVPLNDAEARQRTQELGAMIENAASFGPRSVIGLWKRHHTENWAQELIRRIRAGELQPGEDTPAALIAGHRGLDGEPLDTASAAVELLNVLRPVVAVARFITYSALALHEYPSAREQLTAGDDQTRHRFAQEVRRFYPFFPVIGGRAREPFDWREHHFERGSWILLDLYGTNHDSRIWDQPEAFRPERFAGGDGNAYNLVPQGGGDLHDGHRCPGEGVTVELIEIALRMLTSAMNYRVPPQDLTVDLSEIPAAPKDRLRIRDIVARG